MPLTLLIVLISIAGIVMFITTFIYVMKIWSFLQEVKESGGFPTVTLHRAKRDAWEIIDGRAPWEYKHDDIIKILGEYPEDEDAVRYLELLLKKKEEAPGK